MFRSQDQEPAALSSATRDPTGAVALDVHCIHSTDQQTNLVEVDTPTEK